MYITFGIKIQQTAQLRTVLTVRAVHPLVCSVRQASHSSVVGVVSSKFRRW